MQRLIRRIERIPILRFKELLQSGKWRERDSNRPCRQCFSVQKNFKRVKSSNIPLVCGENQDLFKATKKMKQILAPTRIGEKLKDLKRNPNLNISPCRQDKSKKSNSRWMTKPKRSTIQSRQISPCNTPNYVQIKQIKQSKNHQ